MFKKILNNITAEPKRYLRAALCLLTVIIISVGGLMLDDYIVIDGNNRFNITAYADSIDDVIKSAGIELSDGDAFDVTSEDGKTVISVDRSYSQIITPDTKLAAAEITQNVISYTDDIISSSTDSAVLDSDDCTANFADYGVSYVYETVRKTVKHGYKTVKSRQLEKGKTSIKEGVDGEKELVYRKKVVNGVVLSSELYSEEITKQPVAQIETIGTRVNFSSDRAVQTSEDVSCISTLVPTKPIELDANGIPVSYAESITGKASAYSTGTSTATGVAARPGYIAVNPKQIPYGTKMYIVSTDGKYVYGYAIAADTGGFADNGSGRIADLRFNTKSECSRFGVRSVNIYILE